MARKSQENKTHFKLILDGKEITGFIRISGLSTYINVNEEVNEKTGSIEKSPGYSECKNVTLYKKRTREQPFWNWLKEIQSGTLVKKDILIELNYKNRSLRGWKLINCWPVRWSISDIADKVLNTVEEIELVVEKIELL